MTAPTPSLIPAALTSLQRVKDWVMGTDPKTGGSTFATSDPQLIGLINSASMLALATMSRGPLYLRPVTEVRSGNGRPSILLREWPVFGNVSASAAGQPIAQQANFVGSGLVLENPWDGMSPGNQPKLTYVGGCFAKGAANLQISYVVGYYVQEVQAAATSVYPTQPYGMFTANYRVTLANGTVLTPIASGTPSTGQYIAPTLDNPAYTFASADSGQFVTLTYSYIPADIDFAVTKWVGESFKYRMRIGMKSVSLGSQETTSYQLVAMPDDVKLAFVNYNRVVPL